MINFYHHNVEVTHHCNAYLSFCQKKEAEKINTGVFLSHVLPLHHRLNDGLDSNQRFEVPDRSNRYLHCRLPLFSMFILSYAHGFVNIPLAFFIFS